MDIENVVSAVQVLLPTDRVATEDEIQDIVDRMAMGFGLTPAQRDTVLAKVLARALVKMDTGYALKEIDHVPWVNDRRREIDPFYWERFKLYLQKEGWPGGVITGLDKTTEEILDLLGNPDEQGTWKRRGLVMGDVQSGKTAAYSALICKAADAGYRFVILLTGTIENLRRQTQERLDVGFVGFDSSEQLKRNRQNLRVGVGVLDPRRQATVFTSSSSDFRVSTLDSLGLSLDALREPALVVIKKNTRVIKNLRDWIEGYNASHTGPIDIPLLVIDDEADNASINTADETRDPTRVNAGIRELLALFRRTTYVGFTATPFANIFVNPEKEDEMLGDDLFPRDFIYTLQAPTNYFGARRIFLEDAGAAMWLRTINDLEDAIPTKHRAYSVVPRLPESLLKAVCTFLVANAIRDLRGEGPTHRSMLVNVSHYTRVQDQVEMLLHAELDRFKTDIRNFAALPSETALNNGSIRALHAAWMREYVGTCPNIDWADVQGALRNAALPVTTVAVNQRTGSRALDYKAHRATGLRVIAVGGNSLSRGLTLEGLTVSYFRRSTKMYDTLLQMGRWFGYRTGYEDLCRIWLPQLAIDWYSYISDATEELRSELKRMYRQGRTPRDFGLAVRSSPDALLVTARNKMRSATEIVRVISVSGESFESVELPLSGRQLQRNWLRVERFLEDVQASPDVGVHRENSPRVLRGVPRERVATLLRQFSIPTTEFRFQPAAIAQLLLDLPEGVLDKWDVAIPSGTGSGRTIAEWSAPSQRRHVLIEDPPGVLVVSGTKRRVGSRGVEKAGLSADELNLARDYAWQAEQERATQAGEEPRPKSTLNVADKYYTRARSRPLLLIHVLDPHTQDDTPLPTVPEGGVVAIGLSFPRLASSVGLTTARYKINLVKARELFAGTIGDDDDDLDDEDES